VARRRDDAQTEHHLAISDGGERFGRIDARDVGLARIDRRVGSLLQDARDAADMVAVPVGEDHVADLRPVDAGRYQGLADRPSAPGDAGIDDRRLSCPDEHVGRDEAQIRALPGEGACRGGGRGARGRTRRRVTGRGRGGRVG
jgi:hypothetical protein